MKSRVTAEFWKHYDRLPKKAQKQADLAYKLWVNNYYHPSLQFKRVDPQAPIYSA